MSSAIRSIDRRALRLASVCGIAAVGIYVGTTILGGLLDPGYSQTGRTISELTAASAPDRGLLAVLYVGYNVLLAAFGYAVYRIAPQEPRLRTGMSLLVAGAVAGIGLVTVLPTDFAGGPITPIGSAHIAVAGVAALLTGATTFVMAIGFRRVAALRRLVQGSIAAGVAIVVSGPLSAFAVASGSPYAGVFERITIGLFLLWVWGISVYLLFEYGDREAFDPRVRALRL
jgi:hypothetical membrane protein